MAVAKEPAGKAAGGAWQWSRTAHTQRALLDAAREVFAEQGFAAASIADVVDRAGSSVGSLYHHFGGKSELFLALWQEHQLAHEKAASEAVALARKGGESSFPAPRGGFAVYAKASPTNIYVAYPDLKDVQIEVYDPSPKRARSLIDSGRIAPVP